MKKTTTLTIYVSREQQGSYFPLPFTMEPDVERLDITYAYEKSRRTQENGTIREEPVNIIDLSLCGADGVYLGSSGSDRDHIWVSGVKSCDGYATAPLLPGEWAIVVGAYHVAEEGVEVRYTLTMTGKEKRLFQGDTHVHTTGSDGFLPPEKTADLARGMGLDYLIITDHNNYAHNFSLPQPDGITVLPGTEWTHYKGHAGFLGVARPFEGTFYTNSKEETAEKLRTARERGAMVVLNHPFCPLCPWLWGFDGLEYDGVEIWNGAMSERNLKAVLWWHEQLKAGKKLVAVGGSDFHRPGLFGGIAMPCTCLYAMSREPEDLMKALQTGSSYISYIPNGPGVEANCGGKGLGETIASGSEISLRFFRLKGGDVIKLITDLNTEEIVCEAGVKEIRFCRSFAKKVRFCRFEVWRSYETGLPSLYAMISNPVYFA